MTDVRVVWFRKDLRLHDNRALVAACEGEAVVPLYVFDDAEYGTAEYGGSRSFRYRKTGAHRARFAVESVADLRSSLRARGSDLVVRHGDPGEVVPAVADRVGADRVHFHTYPTYEEVETEEAVKAGLRDRGITQQRYWGHTLYHVTDLPVDPNEIPDTFTPFKNQVEGESAVRDPLERPSIPRLPDGVVEGSTPDEATGGTTLDEATGATTPDEAGDDGPVAVGEVPSPADLDPDLPDPPDDDRAVLPFEGGESRGLDRLEEYVFERDRLKRYKETRNGLLGADFSSKLSPWLNLGCLSPRQVHAAVERYEAERVANDSTYWLVFELTWRDFFQFQFVKHGNAHFTREGIRERTDIEWREDGTAFERWAAGETGVPFVDANMRELNRTGYMSNRGRQNAASFLANNLRIDWRRGAAYFETRLVDYDPASNYGNWAYVAGVGNDSRDRFFDILDQARRYDSEAEYVTTWLPELDGLPPEYAHEPWTMSESEQAEYGVELGVDYPEPMIDLEASYEKLR